MHDESVGTAAAGTQRRVRVAVVQTVAGRVAVADVRAMNQFAGTDDRHVAVGRRAAPPALRAQTASRHTADQSQPLPTAGVARGIAGMDPPSAVTVDVQW